MFRVEAYSLEYCRFLCGFNVTEGMSTSNVGPVLLAAFIRFPCEPAPEKILKPTLLTLNPSLLNPKPETLHP